MPYDSGAMSLIYVGGAGGLNEYHYSTTDSVSTVLAAGYFTDEGKFFQAGDIIDTVFVDDVVRPTSASDARILIVNSVSSNGNVASVTDITARLADGQVTNLKANLEVMPFRNTVSVSNFDFTMHTEVFFVRTACYLNDNDTGGALYARVLTEPTHALKIQSADGQWWEIVAEHGEINTAQGGAVGDGTTNDTAAIQNTVDAAIYFLKCRVKSRPGVCRVISTIHLGYGHISASIHFSGAGVKYRGEANFPGSAIFADFVLPQPILNIQGARGAYVGDLHLDGGLNTTTVQSASPNIATAVTLQATWDALGGNGRYNPRACITIDAYSGVQPGTPYPSVAYPGWAGIVAQYGKNFTSNVTIERVSFANNHAAISVQPCDADGNGDFLKVYDCTFELLMYCISIGNTQSRSVDIRNAIGNRVWCFITNNQHGRQLGRFDGIITHASFSTIMNIYDITNTVFAGALRLQNCYFEALFRVGDVRFGSSGEMDITYDQCRFGYGAHTDATGVPPNVLGLSASTCIHHFQGGDQTGFPSIVSFLGDVRFKRTRINSNERDSSVADQATALFNNASHGGIAWDQLRNWRQDTRHKIFNADTLALVGQVAMYNGDQTTDFVQRQYCLPCGLMDFTSPTQNGSGFVTRDRIIPYNELSKSVFSSVVRSNRTVTMTYTTPPSAHAAGRAGIAEGSFLRDRNTGTVILITDWDQVSGVIEGRLETNYISPDGGTTFNLYDDSFSLTSGSYQIFNSRHYSVDSPILATYTAASNVHSILDRDNFLNNITPPSVGDYIANDSDLEQIFENEEGRITAVDFTTADTITTFGSARRSWSNKQIKHFIRAA